MGTKNDIEEQELRKGMMRLLRTQSGARNDRGRKKIRESNKKDGFPPARE